MRPRVPGASLAVRRPVEQCWSTGRRLERRERRELSPEAGSAGREAKAAGEDATAAGEPPLLSGERRSLEFAPRFVILTTTPFTFLK